MPVKRRNHGRSKMNRGHTKIVNCLNCGRMTPKDKAIKRFLIKGLVDNSSTKDVNDQSLYENYQLPKSYQKAFYCVSCAVHRRVVRPRKHDKRRIRIPLNKQIRNVRRVNKD